MSLRVDWLIPCRYAEAVDGLATMIGAGANVVVMPELPNAAAVHVVGRIAGLAEPGSDHQIVAQVLGPDFAPVAEPVELTLTMGERSEFNPEGWEDHMIVHLALQFPVEEYGVHLVEVRVDERSATLQLHIVGQE